MNKYEEYRTFKFTSKLAANEFLNRVNGIIYKCDVATMFDLLHLAGRSIPSDNKVKGFQYGYAKKDIKSVKPAKIDGVWTIYMPFPGRMVKSNGQREPGSHAGVCQQTVRRILATKGRSDVG